MSRNTETETLLEYIDKLIEERDAYHNELEAKTCKPFDNARLNLAFFNQMIRDMELLTDTLHAIFYTDKVDLKGIINEEHLIRLKRITGQYYAED